MPYFVDSEKTFAIDTEEIAAVAMPVLYDAIVELKNQRKIAMPVEVAKELIAFLNGQQPVSEPKPEI